MGHFSNLGSSFEQTWYRCTRQCYIPNFKHLSQVLLKKFFKYFYMYFYGSNLGPPSQTPSWTLGPSFEQTWYRCTRQCYIPNFKHLSQVILKKIFQYFYMFFYGSNLGPPGQTQSWTLGPSFEQTWYRCTRQCYIPNFKHLGQVVLKKKIFQYIPVHFYGSNLGTLAWGHLGLTKLGKGPPSNDTYQISSP